MSRILLVLCLVLAPCSVAHAGGIALGVHGGSSIPNLRDKSGGNDLSTGWSSRVAPFFGVYGEKTLSPRWALDAEVNYAAQGGKRNGMQPVISDISGLGLPPGMTVYADFDNVAKLDYIEVPLLARYHFDAAQRFSAAFGPFMGFLLSAKTETSGMSVVYADKEGTQPLTPGPVDFTATTDGKSDLNTFNWGIQFGVGYDQPVGSGRLGLELRGGLGLANIQKDTATNGKNGTGNLVVALGYTYGM